MLVVLQKADYYYEEKVLISAINTANEWSKDAEKCFFVGKFHHPKSSFR
jgi:hypothetical protein